VKTPAPSIEQMWTALRSHTAARIGLPTTGASLATAPVLAARLAHAQARDAVHASFDRDQLADMLTDLGVDIIQVDSAAQDRRTYLLRPDLGRRLNDESIDKLTEWQTRIRNRKTLDRCAGDPGMNDQPCETLAQRRGTDSGSPTRDSSNLVVVVTDGLSATAAHNHATPLLNALLPMLRGQGWYTDAVVLARHGRVALGDDVGERLGATAVVVLLGERPGMSSPDSLGAYLTWAPKVGRSDAERNCVSNIRPAGFALNEAAGRIAWLLEKMRSLGASGIALKDDSANPAIVRDGSQG